MIGNFNFYSYLSFNFFFIINFSLDLGDGFLKQFLDDTRMLTPDERGEQLQKCEGILATHALAASEGQTAVSFNLEHLRIQLFNANYF